MIVAIYKPKGPTSHDVIDELRRITGERTIGHAGTLDPLASGVLVVGIGRDATRRLSIQVAKEKEYVARVRLGVSSTTDDEEGKKTEHHISSIPTKREVEEMLEKFLGETLQVPPLYSAVKVAGKKGYEYARKGEDIVLEPRRVTIMQIVLNSYEWPELEIKVTTGPGVYIRSLARDIGRDLGVTGYLTDLERTRVGEYGTKEALTLEEFAKRYGKS
jgi:tRNA pseudouridine55 synthase